MNDKMDSTQKKEWLNGIAQAIQLREGIEGVTKALWALYRKRIRSTRNWSAEIRIPVPVLAAMRRELEKRDFFVKDEKLQVTENGNDILRNLFGKQEFVNQQCTACLGTGQITAPEAYAVIEKFETICQDRPEVDVTLDQSHATAETGVRKALFLLEKGLLGRSIIFMGDDDLISVACFLVRKRFMSELENPGELVVADIDDRYLSYIKEITCDYIKTFKYDVREPLPTEFHDRFDAALTDPSYTLNGITTFAHRCNLAIKKDASLLLSMPLPASSELIHIQSNLLEMGWVIREIHQNFNKYHGASIHANQSTLLLVEKVLSTPPDKTSGLRYTPFYTGEVRPPGGVYACTACNTRHKVGPQDKYLTIKDLKKVGCEECDNDSFRKLNSQELNESNVNPPEEK